MQISLKVGSVIHIPYVQGTRVVSGSPDVLVVTFTPTSITITALKAGIASVALGAGSDFIGSLLVAVVSA